MLAKKFRLPVPEFYAQRKKTKTARSASLAVRWAPNTLLFSRFAVIVKKSEEKRATRRNKVRRMVFNAIRSLRAHEIKGYDILISASPAPLNSSPGDAKAEVEEIINLIKLKANN